MVATNETIDAQLTIDDACEEFKLAKAPPLAIAELAEVFRSGAKKHKPGDWRENYRENFRELFAKHDRHMHAALNVEDIDEESGTWHLARAAANLLIALELCLTAEVETVELEAPNNRQENEV